MSKRDQVIEAIEAGEATKETLMVAADVNAKGLASIFSTLRLMGKCPITREDGLIEFVTQEEWQEFKAERSANSKPKAEAKSLPERKDAADKRVVRCSKAVEAAETRFDKDPTNVELDLRKQKAAIELKIAELEAEKVDILIADAPESGSDDVVETTDDVME